jgi:hypothetical protein
MVMKDNTQSFTIDDIQRHVEAVQNDIAKKEHRIELMNPLLIGACVSCGGTLLDKSDPAHMCHDCKENINRELYEFEKKKRKAQVKGKKMSNRNVIHISTIRPLGM